MKLSSTIIDFLILLARIVLGIGLLTHGYPKLMNFIEGDYAFTDPLGIGPLPTLIIAIITEVLGSVFLILGLWTRWTVIPIILTMLTAVFFYHSGDPFADLEKPLVYAMGFLLIFVTGAGKFSIDGIIKSA